MTLGDKISKLRKDNNYTQEQLADILGVSRQSISKWESDIAYPETDKLVKMGKLFECSMDYLLNEDISEKQGIQPTEKESLWDKLKLQIHERKSEKTVMGMPLWHIARNAKGFVAVGLNARGVIAIGLKAQGVVSLGMLSIGVFSFGMLSIGLLAIGLFALGVLSAGCFALGILTAGAISFGVISIGAIATGEFSVGALAIGKYFALGDNARAMVAIGDTEADGSVFQKIGELSAQDIADVKQSLDTVVPAYFSWAKELIKLFL